MKKKVLIVVSDYYKDIADSLLKSTKKFLNKKTKLNIIKVPGVFEIPVIISKNIKKFDGFVAIGCVIRGKTPHFNLICKSTFDSILNLSIIYNKPIGNGIITALNITQAKERCGLIKSNKPNKGLEATQAVLSILKNGTKKI